MEEERLVVVIDINIVIGDAFTVMALIEKIAEEQETYLLRLSDFGLAIADLTYRVSLRLGRGEIRV